MTLGPCLEFNETNLILGEITSSLDILDPFIYDQKSYHDGSSLLKCSKMEVIQDPFEIICAKLRREIALGKTEKEEKRDNRLKQERKKEEYVRHKSDLLTQLLG